MIAWLVYFDTEKCTFMFDTKLNDIPDTILKWVSRNICIITEKLGKDSVFLLTKNLGTRNKLIVLGAELLENEDSEIRGSQFVLIKSFLNNNI